MGEQIALAASPVDGHIPAIGGTGHFCESAVAHKDILVQPNAMEKKDDSQFQIAFTAIWN